MIEGDDACLVFESIERFLSEQRDILRVTLSILNENYSITIKNVLEFRNYLFEIAQGEKYLCCRIKQYRHIL